MAQNLVVKTEGLCKSYPLAHGMVHALRTINLEILEGESVAVMGPSGSGKSTLLQLIGCLDRPSAGKYYLNSREVSLLDDQQLSVIRGTSIGFIFQSYNLIPHLNLYENLEVPFLYHPFPLSVEEVQERIMQAIKKVKLEHRVDHLPSQLSGGEAQRAAIARALAIRPLLLLADEPTGNLDRETGSTILKLFDDLHREGTTLVIVTHDAHVAAHCQRIVRMQDGCVEADVRASGWKQTC